MQNTINGLIILGIYLLGCLFTYIVLNLIDKYFKFPQDSNDYKCRSILGAYIDIFCITSWLGVPAAIILFTLVRIFWAIVWLCKLLINLIDKLFKFKTR